MSYLNRINILDDGTIGRMSQEEYDALRLRLDQGFAWPERPDDWCAAHGLEMLLRPEEVTALLNSSVQFEVVDRRPSRSPMGSLYPGRVLAPLAETSDQQNWLWLTLAAIALAFVVAITS